jgi:hypothetical protein
MDHLTPPPSHNHNALIRLALMVYILHHLVLSATHVWQIFGL